LVHNSNLSLGTNSRERVLIVLDLVNEFVENVATQLNDFLGCLDYIYKQRMNFVVKISDCGFEGSLLESMVVILPY
jgi:hypothetical protein